eukprot:6233809-Amphidinium_carterae.1
MIFVESALGALLRVPCGAHAAALASSRSTSAAAVSWLRKKSAPGCESLAACAVWDDRDMGSGRSDCVDFFSW